MFKAFKTLEKEGLTFSKPHLLSIHELRVTKYVAFQKYDAFCQLYMSDGKEAAREGSAI